MEQLLPRGNESGKPGRSGPEPQRREALANAIVHGCNNDPSKIVECCVACTESSDVVIVVRDPGEGFVLTDVPNPLAEKNPYSTHGRGIISSIN